MGTSFWLAIRQLSDKEFRSILLRSLSLALAVFLGLFTVAWFFLLEVNLPNFWLVEKIVNILGGLALLFLISILFPAIASFFVTLFLDEIADAVEARYYSNIPPSGVVSLLKTIFLALRFTGLSLVLNLIALPIYLITFWFPPIAFSLFFCLNGYLFGREYFELVATRHLSIPNMEVVRKANMRRLFTAGVIITFLLTIPIINLFAPIIGVAAMVHLFHSLSSETLH